MGVREREREREQELVQEAVPSESDEPDPEVVVDPASASQPIIDASPDRTLEPPRWLPLVRPVALVVLLASIAAALFVAFRHNAGGGAGGDPWRPTTNGQELVGIGVILLPAILALPVLVLRPERGRSGSLITTSAAWTLTLVLSLASLWYLIAAAVDLRPQVGTPVLSDAEVETYLAAFDRDRPLVDPLPPIRVPTGVLIQSVEFLNANNVEVTGFVWQTYGPDVPAEISRGFVLPEASSAAYNQQEAYRITKPDGSEVIGWYVSATLREAFDYRQYPFDRQDVWLRLWHRDFERGVLLVPDFDAYQTSDPAAMAGLDPQFVYGAWHPRFTSFSYETNPYQTSFGYGAEGIRGEFPELYFSLGLKRDFWGPFFDHVTLGFAIAVLLYGVLILTTSDRERRERFGSLTTAGVFGACTGLLFTNLLEQNQIRQIVAGQQVAYMEVLPFVLNVGIAGVAFNSILLNSTKPPRFVLFKDNLLPDLLFWPAMLGLLVVATLIVFFGG